MMVQWLPSIQGVGNENERRDREHLFILFYIYILLYVYCTVQFYNI